MMYGSGNPEAEIMVIGEFLSYHEELQGRCFLDSPGEMLIKTLSKAGIFLNECYCTNVLNFRPQGDYYEHLVAFREKDRKQNWEPIRSFYCGPRFLEHYNRLYREIELVKPKVIIALGNLAQWVLTGISGIQKWRGSILELLDQSNKSMGIPVIPTFHPNQLIIVPENIPVSIVDIKRARNIKEKGYKKPGNDWIFVIHCNFYLTIDFLDGTLHYADKGYKQTFEIDLETKLGYIACIGISWNTTEAKCIPFMVEGNFDGCWTLEEETAIIYRLYRLLTHENITIAGQNLLYDCQYIYRHWNFLPREIIDTMISHHTCFAGLPNNLAFQASLYCDDYINWKPDKITWKEGG